MLRSPVWTTDPESSGKGPRNRHLLEVSIQVNGRWTQRSLLTWKSESMKSANPCGLEMLWDSGGCRGHYRKLSWGCVWLELGADILPRPAALLGNVFVKIVTPPFPWLIYVTVGKQLPEQPVPPLSIININVCTGLQLLLSVYSRLKGPWELQASWRKIRERKCC